MAAISNDIKHLLTQKSFTPAFAKRQRQTSNVRSLATPNQVGASSRLRNGILSQKQYPAERPRYPLAQSNDAVLRANLQRLRSYLAHQPRSLRPSPSANPRLRFRCKSHDHLATPPYQHTATIPTHQTVKLSLCSPSLFSNAFYGTVPLCSKE